MAQIPHDRNNRFGVVDDYDDVISEDYDGNVRFPDLSGQDFLTLDRQAVLDYITAREVLNREGIGTYADRWDRSEATTLRKKGDWDRRATRNGWDVSKVKLGGPFNILFSSDFSHEKAGLGPVTP